MLLILHFWFTVFMVGLSWFVQVVHYPLFHQVTADRFAQYSHLNQRRTSYVVIPPMLGELVTGIWLLFLCPTCLVIILLSILLVLNWAVTIGLAIPAHKKLSHAKSDLVINRLIAAHSVRTAIWTIRSILIAYLIYVYRI